MSPTLPLVTVGMAVYNGERYIGEAIESVLSEDYPNWELLLVDDRSPDASAEIIRAFADPRIRLVENEVNLGLVGVRNRILREARGTYIAWLDQDDITMPRRLDAQVAFLEAHPEYALCGSWTAMRTETAPGTFTDSTERLPETHEQIRAAMLFLNPVACNTVTMRVEAFTGIGLWFRPEFGNSLDYDLWSNASDSLRVRNLPEVLGAYRVHEGQTSQGAALDRMNAHALQIQADLAQRALGIDMSEADRHWHAMATVSPIVVTDPADLDHVAAWFGRLREANVSTRAFDAAEFDRALARQWTSVVLGAIASGLPRSTAMSRAMAGFRTVGVARREAGASIVAGVRRRMARRS